MSLVYVSVIETAEWIDILIHVYQGDCWIECLLGHLCCICALLPGHARAGHRQEYPILQELGTALGCKYVGSSQFGAKLLI